MKNAVTNQTKQQVFDLKFEIWNLEYAIEFDRIGSKRLELPSTPSSAYQLPHEFEQL